MSPDESNDVIGQVLTQQSDTAQDAGRDFEAEIAKLRKEAADWRTKFRGAEQQLGELRPVAEQYAEQQAAQKTEAEKLAERMAQLEAQLATTKTEADRARRTNSLITLAVKAGIPADVVQYLDVTKFDLEDEEGTLKALASLAPSKQIPAVGAGNPARKAGEQGVKIGDEAIKAFLQGGGAGTNLFGD